MKIKGCLSLFTPFRYTKVLNSKCACSVRILEWDLTSPLLFTFVCFMFLCKSCDLIGLIVAHDHSIQLADYR